MNITGLLFFKASDEFILRLQFKYNSKQMQKAKAAVSQFDLFAATPTLRSRGSSEVVNSCTGVFSILFMGFFAYVLIQLIVNIANEQKIQANERIETNTQSIRNSSITRFALYSEFAQQQTLEDANFTAKFFQIHAFKLRKSQNKNQVLNQTQEQYEIEQCSEEQKKEFNFLNEKVTLWCLKQNKTINIVSDPQEGFYQKLQIHLNFVISDKVRLYLQQYCEEIINCKIICQQTAKQQQILQEQCKAVCLENIWKIQQLQSECKNQIKNLLEAIKNSTQEFYPVFLYMQNVAFDPTAANPIVNLNSEIKTTFTTQRGSQKEIQIDHYRIETDQSLLPWESMSVSQGWMLGKESEASFEFAKNDHAAQFVFKHSASTKVISRKIGKLDEALSYVGGLFGIVVGFFAFFLASFNEYKYELQISEQAFNHKSDGKKFKSRHFNFWQYVKYSFYDWADALLCCEFRKSGRCKQIHETREEINEQLSVAYLFRRLQYYERVFEYILKKEERIALYLTEPPSIDDLAKMRKISQYYEKIVDGTKALTLQDLEKVEEQPSGVLAMPTERVVEVQDKTNKQGFPDDSMLRKRKGILELALDTFHEQSQAEGIEIDGQDSAMEQEIANALFNLSDKKRSKIQEKIPLKVLRRLKAVHEKQRRSLIANPEHIEGEDGPPRSSQRFMRGLGGNQS